MLKSYRDKDTIGDVAANGFRKLAGGVGLTVNESQKDRAGWDFILDANAAAVDEEPSVTFGHFDAVPITARVQVKGTDTRKGAVDIPLSNWVQLVEHQGPAFFFVTELEGEGAIQKAWLIHVDREMWEEVERRKWENETNRGKKANRPLHKLSMRLRYDDRDPLPELTGRALLDALGEAVGPSMTAYTKAKAESRERVGFEKGNAAVTVTFPGGAAPDVILSDVQLGLRDPIPLREFIAMPTRFGLPDERRAMALGPAEIHVPYAGPRLPVDVVYEVPELAIEARYGAELSIPTAFAQRYQKGASLDGIPLKIEAPHTQLVVRFEREVTFLPHFEASDERVPLRRLYEVVDLFDVYKQAILAQARPTIRVTNPQTGDDLLTLAHVGLDEVDAESELEQHPPDWLTELVRDAWAVARAFNAEDRVEVSVHELIDAARSVSWLASTSAGGLEAELAFSVDLTGDAAEVLAEMQDVVLSFPVILGNSRFSIAAHLLGELEPSGEPDRFRVGIQGTDHVVRQFTREDTPPPDGKALAHRSIRALDRRAVCLVWEGVLGEGEPEVIGD